jgi:hypothetical protein
MNGNRTLHAAWENPNAMVRTIIYARAMGATVSYPNIMNHSIIEITFNGISQRYTINNGKIDANILNARFGWANSWIPNGHTHSAYIGIHEAFFPRNVGDHASIIVFAAPGSVFYGAEYTENAFRNYTGVRGSSSRYVAFGGEASQNPLTNWGSWGHVISKNNRESDVDLARKTFMIPLNVTIANIHSLLENARYFEDNQATWNLKYDPATIPANTYNSNSFARGLIDASGIVGYANPAAAPGWGRPIPASYFGR